MVSVSIRNTRNIEFHWIGDQFDSTASYIYIALLSQRKSVTKVRGYATVYPSFGGKKPPAPYSGRISSIIAVVPDVLLLARDRRRSVPCEIETGGENASRMHFQSFLPPPSQPACTRWRCGDTRVKPKSIRSLQKLVSSAS